MSPGLKLPDHLTAVVAEADCLAWDGIGHVIHAASEHVTEQSHGAPGHAIPFLDAASEVYELAYCAVDTEMDEPGTHQPGHILGLIRAADGLAGTGGIQVGLYPILAHLTGPVPARDDEDDYPLYGSSTELAEVITNLRKTERHPHNLHALRGCIRPFILGTRPTDPWRMTNDRLAHLLDDYTRSIDSRGFYSDQAWDDLFEHLGEHVFPHFPAPDKD